MSDSYLSCFNIVLAVIVRYDLNTSDEAKLVETHMSGAGINNMLNYIYAF